MSERKSSRDLSQPEVPSKLALAHLKTLRWAQEQETLMYIFHATAKRYLNLKKNFLVGWYFLMIEVVVVWWWTFFHNFPMPQLLMKLLGQVDSGIIYMLDIVQRRIDWWRDVAGVRFMWFKESVVFFLDRNLTTADKYFAILQDRIFTIINYFMKPVRYIGRKTTDIAMQKSIVKSEAAVPRAKNGSLRRNSEGYEADDHEDWADEDYLSDASLDSRRLMKEDSRGELRQANGGVTNKPKQKIFTRISTNVGREDQNPESDADNPGKYEWATLPHQTTDPNKGSQRSLARFFASFGESKKESPEQIHEVGKPASPSAQRKWYKQSPPTKPRGSPAILRARAASPPTNGGDSGGESPETRRRRGFGRFSLKRQRSRK